MSGGVDCDKERPSLCPVSQEGPRGQGGMCLGCNTDQLSLPLNQSPVAGKLRVCYMHAVLAPMKKISCERQRKDM